MITDDLRKGILDELKVVEKLVRADLLAQYRADPGLMARAMQRLREEESSPGDSAAWLETFAGRGAALYILKTLYVRILEDQGLLRPIRLRDGGTYETFRSLFPQLGHAAYLRRVFDDAERAIPELFALTPIEIATPSGAAATAAWNVWQLPAPGGGPRFDFIGELDTRFIGDLYQDLDPEVRDRYALWQTPRFVEDFILDRTLDPAMLHFGINDFRIIDPTCGSGHFLLGAFERIALAWRKKLGSTPEDRWNSAKRALASTFGADLNEYACAISRFRLLLAIVKETGVTDLQRLQTLHFNVLSCDSLIPWERLSQELLPGTHSAWLTNYGTDNERVKNEDFFSLEFHAVVGNPPYPSPSDAKKNRDYRSLWPESAAGLYSLSAPMTERFLRLARQNAFVGLIVANNFAKREFGKTLVTKTLSSFDFTLVVDCSGAFIPGHGTPTVMIFARNQRQPDDGMFTLVSGKRGEPTQPLEPAQGFVWSTIVQNFASAEFEDRWISVRQASQKILSHHPWTFGSKIALTIFETLQQCSSLSEVFSADCGYCLVIKEDDAFYRRRARGIDLRPITGGAQIRDWTFANTGMVLFPYANGRKMISRENADLDLWGLRTSLYARATFEGSFKSSNRSYYEYGQIHAIRCEPTTLKIAFSEIGSNSHFCIADDESLFDQTSPVITLGSHGRESLNDVVAILNSSSLEFWFKQVCFDKGNGGINGGISAEDWEKRYVRNGTNVLRAPLPAQTTGANRELAISRRAIMSCIDSVLTELMQVSPSKIFTSALGLDSEIALGERRTKALREQLVGLQEELDWNVYGAFELLNDVPANDLAQPVALARGHRPFEIALARRVDNGEEESAWFSRHGLIRTTEIPEGYVGAQRAILERRLELVETDPTINFLEQPVHKRRWTFEPWDKMVVAAAETWLLDAIETILRDAASSLSLAAEVVTVLAETPKNLIIAAYAKTGTDIGLTDTVARLLNAESIPDNPARLLTAGGLRKLVGPQTAAPGEVGTTPRAEPFSPGESVDWKRVWRLQEREDASEAVVIALPPPFVRTDYSHPNGWRIRGKFNVANERFIVYDELSPKRYAWGGRTIPERARLSAEAFDLRGRQAEAAEAQAASVQPTPESPARCGIQFPLWDKLDELRRLGDPNYGDVRELAMLCGRTCPCDVLEHWRAQARPTRARRAVAVIPGASAATRVPAEELDPSLLERLVESIRRTGDAGAPAATLEPLAAGDRKLLTRALETLRTSGLIEPTGRGRAVRYRLPANRLL